MKAGTCNQDILVINACTFNNKQVLSIHIIWFSNTEYKSHYAYGSEGLNGNWDFISAYVKTEVNEGLWAILRKLNALGLSQSMRRLRSEALEITR